MSFFQLLSMSPARGPLCATLPTPRTHSPSSACSPSGPCINKRREKVTQLASTELSLTRMQIKCAEVVGGSRFTKR